VGFVTNEPPIVERPPSDASVPHSRSQAGSFTELYENFGAVNGLLTPPIVCEPLSFVYRLVHSPICSHW
jgi:hypothetical protein